jgi:hypothetical protein
MLPAESKQPGKKDHGRWAFYRNVKRHRMRREPIMNFQADAGGITVPTEEDVRTSCPLIELEESFSSAMAWGFVENGKPAQATSDAALLCEAVEPYLRGSKICLKGKV